MDTQEFCSIILSGSLDIVKQLSTVIGPDPLQLDHEIRNVDRADNILPNSLPVNLEQKDEQQEQNVCVESTGEENYSLLSFILYLNH